MGYKYKRSSRVIRGPYIRQKNDDIILETTSKQGKDRCYRLPALGSVQAGSENLPQEKSGCMCDGREVCATCDMQGYVRAVRFFLCTSNNIKRIAYFFEGSWCVAVCEK